MTSHEPVYPEVEVQLTGEDGNAFGILARVDRAMRKAGLPQEARDLYREQAMAGDYDHLLSVTMKTVTVS